MFILQYRKLSNRTFLSKSSKVSIPVRFSKSRPGEFIKPSATLTAAKVQPSSYKGWSRPSPGTATTSSSYSTATRFSDPTVTVSRIHGAKHFDRQGPVTKAMPQSAYSAEKQAAEKAAADLCKKQAAAEEAARIALNKKRYLEEISSIRGFRGNLKDVPGVRHGVIAVKVDEGGDIEGLGCFLTTKSVLAGRDRLGKLEVLEVNEHLGSSYRNPYEDQYFTPASWLILKCKKAKLYTLEDIAKMPEGLQKDYFVKAFLAASARIMQQTVDSPVTSLELAKKELDNAIKESLNK